MLNKYFLSSSQFLTKYFFQEFELTKKEEEEAQSEPSPSAALPADFQALIDQDEEEEAPTGEEDAPAGETPHSQEDSEDPEEEKEQSEEDKQRELEEMQELLQKDNPLSSPSTSPHSVDLDSSLDSLLAYLGSESEEEEEIIVLN